MSKPNAWVTLTTNDSYALGALVLAHSLKRVGTRHEIAILVTPGVSQAMKTQLKAAFSHVEEVDVLDSKDVANLKLLTRPELGITFTKLHCWRLVQYEKCVFLDADTLVLQNCDELFEKEEFSAAPDAGWPDCFNSGVFVYKPSVDTFSALIDFALAHGSFDGGDQGLLNLYFSDWATKDISKHLSFVYNMCSTATYSYLPALKQYGKNIKIIHFIGTSKPWLHPFNSQTNLVSISESTVHLAPFLQTWWDLFCSHVHPVLSSEMGMFDSLQSGMAGALSKIKLGSAVATVETAIIEDQLRRQSWEQGVIDYMGRDAFTNIWDKICQTVGGSSQPESVPEETVDATTESPADLNLVATPAATEQVSVTAVQTSIVGSAKTAVTQSQNATQTDSADVKKTVPPISTTETAPFVVQPGTPIVTSPTPPQSPTGRVLVESVEALQLSDETQPPVPPKRHQKKSDSPKSEDSAATSSLPAAPKDTSSHQTQKQGKKGSKGK